MGDARISQEALVTALQGTPAARLSQEALVTVLRPTPDARLSQVCLVVVVPIEIIIDLTEGAAAPMVATDATVTVGLLDAVTVVESSGPLTLSEACGPMALREESGPLTLAEAGGPIELIEGPGTFELYEDDMNVVTFEIIRGSTRPPFAANLMDNAGAAIDLTGATAARLVVASVVETAVGSLTLNITLTFHADRTTGQVYKIWASADTSAVPEGVYIGQVEIDWAVGSTSKHGNIEFIVMASVKA